MIPQYFDIEKFASDLSVQAKDSFPLDVPEDVKNFILKTIVEYIVLSGNWLKREKFNYSIDETILIIQLIGEWMFHKGIDNYKNNIPQEYWEHISQQLSVEIYESAKKSIAKGDTTEETINNVEVVVDKKIML